MLHTLEETKKFIKSLEKYPENIRSILFNIWQKSLEGFDVNRAKTLSKSYPLFPMLSCVAGLDYSKISMDSNYNRIANNICYDYLKQFHPDLFKEN